MVKLNSSCDLDLLPLEHRYRIVSSQRCASGDPAGKCLVRVHSPEIDKRVTLLTRRDCGYNTFDGDVLPDVLRGLRVTDNNWRWRTEEEQIASWRVPEDQLRLPLIRPGIWYYRQHLV